MLVKCPACQGKVSLQAAACPHCGLPVSKFSPPGALILPPDTRILRSDPDAAAKWEDIRLKLREAEVQQRQACPILQAVAQAEERQAEMLEILRDRAWQLFSAAGCPHCRAHTVKRLDGWQRFKLAARGRLWGALLHSKTCLSCGRAW